MNPSNAEFASAGVSRADSIRAPIDFWPRCATIERNRFVYKSLSYEEAKAIREKVQNAMFAVEHARSSPPASDPMLPLAQVHSFLKVRKRGHNRRREKQTELKLL